MKASVRPVSAALHQRLGHFAQNLSPFPLLRGLLDLSNIPAPQVITRAARGTTLVLQEEKLLTNQRLPINGDSHLAQGESSPIQTARRQLSSPFFSGFPQAKSGMT